ncbi:hypothetical protein [Rhizobium skierniewicense]|uniref:hypothetical protein n=1 Tax=Rhizobium skierniewicense TaxID=984260 RepID=UPI001574E6CF|nr:hypothetical protein [Rhizobium skierniewicense]NTF34260.1 hypothetical protein [Rhizobium skierniewicense]
MAASVKVWQTDIVAFAWELLGIKLTPKQTEIVNAFMNNERITIRGGAGFGKTMSMAIILWWALVTYDEVQVTVFGPNEGQLKGAFWNEVLSLYTRMDPVYANFYDVQATKVERRHNAANCFAEFRLANKDNPAGARGIHKTNNFLIVDEATGVDRDLFTDAFMNVLSDPNPKLCLVSNPDKIDSFFYDTFYDEYVSDGWVKIHGTMRDGPFMTDEKYEAIARNYGGVTSRKYRVMALGEFPVNDTDCLISKELIDAAVENEFAIPSHEHKIKWGLDPSGKGKDKTVLMQRHHNTAKIVAEWQQHDSIQLAEAVLDTFKKTPIHERPHMIYVDAVGIGDSLYPILQRMGLPVTPVKGSNRPTRKPHTYFNLRSQLWVETRDWFAEGNVCIPKHPDLIRELLAPTYEEFPKYKVEKKEDMKKRLKRSPDFADALCLTFYHSETVGSSAFTSELTYQNDFMYE